MKLIHHHFETLISTNDWAKEKLASFDRNCLTLITADEQTKGRGQYGRKWISPKNKNIYASFCFFIDEEQQDPLSLTHVLAITIANVLKAHKVECRIKWPNDLIVKQKKMGGILCETLYFTSQFGVIIGMGLNVNMSEDDLKQVEQPTTSLNLETDQIWEIPPLLQSITTLFQQKLRLFLDEGFSPFLPTFRKLILPGALYNQHASY